MQGAIKRAVHELLNSRAERLRKTDFGELDVLADSEERSQQAHNELLQQIDQLRGTLHGEERRHRNRRKEDKGRP